jgi:hypothetical protein
VFGNHQASIGASRATADPSVLTKQAAHAGGGGAAQPSRSAAGDAIWEEL